MIGLLGLKLTFLELVFLVVILLKIIGTTSPGLVLGLVASDLAVSELVASSHRIVNPSKLMESGHIGS